MGVLASYRHDLSVLSLSLSEAISCLGFDFFFFSVNLPINSKNNGDGTEWTR